MKHTDAMLERATAQISDFGVPDDEAGELAYEVLRDALSAVPEPIDLTQLPAYIELQKRLVLAEAKLEAVRKYVEDDSFDSFYRKHLLPILDDQ